MRTFVVGDVHGAGEELQAVLEKAKYKANEDRLYLVWSIIKRYNAICTLGNHEQKFRKYLSGYRKGGLPPHYFWALNNLVAHGVSVEEFFEFISNMPLLVEPQNGVIVTHAGVNVQDPYKEEEGANVYGCILPDSPMPLPEPGDGETYWWDLYKGDPLVIYGHLVTHQNKPRYNYSAKGEVNSIGIDTAMVHGGFATAYVVETKEIFQYSSGVSYFTQLKEEFKKNPPLPNKVILKFVEAKTKGLTK
jgi:hypothetical protein